MGIQTDYQLDNESAEKDFRHLLSSFGEPTPVLVPPDLVVRTARRIPPHAPHIVLRRQRIRFAIRLFLVLLVILLAVLGLISQSSGPSAMLFGSGDVGLSRVLLMSQLALKPLVATIQSLSMLLFGLGLIAMVTSLAMLRFAVQPLSARASRRG